MVSPVQPTGTNTNKKHSNSNNNGKNAAAVSSSAANARPSNSTSGGGGSNSNRKSNSSPFHKISHEQVLQKIEELQRKDRNGDKLSRKLKILLAFFTIIIFRLFSQTHSLSF
jgi:hypothetical protein